MAGYRSGPAAAALVLACTAGLVTSCSPDGGEPAAPSTATSSPSAGPQPSTPTASDGASATPAPSDNDCSSAERRAARNIWLWRAVGEVTGAPTGYSDKARQTVVTHTAKVERQLRDRCGRLPAAFEQFSTDIQPTVAADRFGNPQLDNVLAAWLRWGSAVGAPEAARSEIRELEACRQELFPHFDASYRIWWKWTETGKAWWVDIAFDNRTGKVLDGGMGGMAKVTRGLEDPFGWENGPKPGPGKNATLRWGGSSAEVLELQPGTTMLRAAPDIDPDVHTTSDGTFRVIELTVGLGPRGERYGCSPPVRPIP